MINNIVQLKFPTHVAHIGQDEDTGQIICFKHDADMCDFESFSNTDELADWMIAPLPSIVYRVVTSDES